MAIPEPLSPFRVTLPCGVFTVQARSLQAAILRAQADALDGGALDGILAPLKTDGAEMTAEVMERSFSNQVAIAPSPLLVDPALEGTEPPLTGMEVRRRLGLLKGNKTLNHSTLCLAMRNGLPSHPNPMGRGKIFYWSEVKEFLKPTEPPPPIPPTPRFPARRGPGRPPVYHPPTGRPRK